MAERSILAYFPSEDAAQSIVPKLRTLRAIDLQVDHIDRYGGDPVDVPMNPLTANVNSLAGLTLSADLSSRDTGILMAADVNASGMSDGGQGGPRGLNVLLTAVVDAGVYDQALRLVQEAGGTL